ncbi:MAG: gfo/Idh/MocA family oxidoreductase [Deltaproteobacteria bacterium]|nr:gfo/Idh/MocA family oxidoreductase [Deltaproteobacteria bacterium]
MSDNIINHMWVIGSGPMTIDYIKVLDALKVSYQVIGRGIDSAKDCESKTGVKVVTGGLESHISDCKDFPSSAIVAVGVEQLANVAKVLLQNGVKKILIEKPGGLNEDEIRSVHEKTKKRNAEVYVAYNRRFYTSTLKAQEIIREDGGVRSFNFEFTEWSHEIVNIKKAPGVKENWLLANSSHVIDLAFFLGGKPKEISCYVGGALDWHPSGSIFTGAGISEKDALFSYQADWGAPGRWSVEVLTKKHRLIFKPLEKLQIQNIGEVAINEVAIDDDLDRTFKPGLFRQVKAFMDGDLLNLLKIEEHLVMLKYYLILKKISSASLRKNI